jgi:hypothetical protein
MIIGFGHKKRVGKNEAAKLLQELYAEREITARCVSFASKLKECCELYFGLKDEFYYEFNPEERNEIIPKINKTPRQIWIEVGNKMREVYPNVWVDALLDQKYKEDVLIVTDVRFPNEVQAIKARNGILVKIVRDSVPNTDDAADCALDHYNAWDRTIYNNGTLNALKRSLEDVSNPHV